MKCERKGCSEEATQRPVINIPAKGYAITPKSTLKMQLGLNLCVSCVKRMEVKDFIGKGTKGRELANQIVAGKAPLNFKKAFITSEGLATEEGQRFNS